MSFIQAYVQCLADTSDPASANETFKFDTHSISSYSFGPNELDQDGDDSSQNNDTKMVVEHSLSHARKSYASWENVLIWQAYNKSDEPEKRRKELSKIASQLGRSYNGILKQLCNLRKKDNAGPEKNDDSDTDSTNTTSSSPSFSADKSSERVIRRASVLTAPSTRIRRGTGFQYTEEEEVAIWAAYLSSTNKAKQKEALHEVARQYGRTFGAVWLHLSIMRDAQFTGLIPTVQKEQVSEECDSVSSEVKMTVNQVSDLSDSDTQPCTRSERAEVPALLPTTRSLEVTSHTNTTHAHCSLSSASLLFTYPAHVGSNSQYMPRADTSLSHAVSPYNASPANKYGHSEMSLNSYRNTVRAEVYAPETVNSILGGFMKTLRAEDMDLIYPIEAHDQVCCRCEE